MDGPPPRHTVTAQFQTLFERCLPVTTAARLLPELVSAWSGACPGCTVTVVAAVPRARNVEFCRQPAVGAPLFRSLVAVDPPDLAGQADCLRRFVLASVQASQPENSEQTKTSPAAPLAAETAELRSIPLQHHGQSVGVVLLEGSAAAGLATAAPAELPGMTAALLAQLAALRKRPTAAEFSQQLQEQRLESLAEFAAGAGHEINNPATTIAGRARLLLEHETDPGRRQSLETIGAEALRIRDMIGDTMLFGRPPAPVPEHVPAVAALRQAIERFGQSLAERGRPVILETPPAAESLYLLADPVQLEIAVGALLANAVQAVADVPDVPDAGPRITLRLDHADTARHSDPSVSRTVRLTVTDNGCGFSDLEARHLFDPFFSGRQAGRGLGFGLSKAWRIVRAHGGTIQLTSLREPTVLTVFWPMAESPAEFGRQAGPAQAADSEPDAAPGG